MTSSINRLRWCATGLLALAFIVAGTRKIVSADAGLTMVGRYLPAPAAVRALGCMETAVALWLLSARSPRLAATTAGFALTGLTLLIGFELQRDGPLPCGCLPIFDVADATSSVVANLWLSLLRNVFLIGLCIMSGTLVHDDTNAERYAAGIIGTKLSRFADRR